MSMGPVEYMVVSFPGNRFNGDLVPALSELVEKGIVNIVDLAFIHKDEAGNLTVVEVENLDNDLGVVFAGLEGEVGDLLNADDLLAEGHLVPNNSTAAVIIWENVWATRFAAAVRESGGEVVDSGRIPFDVVRAALDYAGTAA